MCPLGQESREIGWQTARMLAGSTESERRERECEMRRRLDHLLSVGDVIRASAAGAVTMADSRVKGENLTKTSIQTGNS